MSLKNELTTPKSINTLKNDVYVDIEKKNR